MAISPYQRVQLLKPRAIVYWCYLPVIFLDNFLQAFFSFPVHETLLYIGQRRRVRPLKLFPIVSKCAFLSYSFPGFEYHHQLQNTKHEKEKKANI